MYVCMYTMILPLHFSLPIYSPWQKKKKKKKNSHKIKKRRWALARARIYFPQNKMNLFILSGHAGDSFAAFLNEVIL